MATDSTKVKVLVQTFGGQVRTVEAATPAQIAESLALSLDNTTINVNSNAADATTILRENDFVAFVTEKVTSG